MSLVYNGYKLPFQMHLVVRKDKFCFKTSMISSVLCRSTRNFEFKSRQTAGGLAVYAGGLVRFRSFFFSVLMTVCSCTRASAHVTQPHDCHMEGFAEVCGPTFSKQGPPLNA